MIRACCDPPPYRNILVVKSWHLVVYVDTPGALFNEVITRRSEMDMQVKMREDPLYAIR